MILDCFSTCCELTVANRSVSADRSSAGATSCMQGYAVAFLIVRARAAAAAVDDESSSVATLCALRPTSQGRPVTRKRVWHARAAMQLSLQQSTQLQGTVPDALARSRRTHKRRSLDVYHNACGTAACEPVNSVNSLVNS